MKLSNFSKSLNNSQTTNKILIYSLAISLTVNVMQQYKINDLHERIVLLPPNLTEEAQVAWNTASPTYLSQFGLYIVTQISNTVPSTVDYTIKTLQPYFAKPVWNQLKKSIEEIRDDPSYEGINPISSFQALGSAIYEKETDTFFISGRVVSSAYKNGVLVPVGAVTVTYEYKAKVQNGLPYITEFWAYEGPPHTLDWAKGNKATYEKERADRAEQAEYNKDVINLPKVPDQKINIPDNTENIPVGTAVDTAGQIEERAQGIRSENGLSPLPKVTEDEYKKALEEAKIKNAELGREETAIGRTKSTDEEDSK